MAAPDIISLPPDYPGQTLLPDHFEYLENSGISPTYLEKTPLIRSAETLADLPDYFRERPDITRPRGILFGWRAKGGSIEWQLRLDEPLTDPETGRVKKYLMRADSGIRYGLILKRTGSRVLIVEGTKQGHSVASAIDMNTSVIQIPGCTGWSRGGWQVPNDMIHLTSGKQTFILLDADAAENPDVFEAGEKLAKGLSTAATVRFIPCPGGGKQGIDDFLSEIEDERQRREILSSLMKNTSARPATRRPTRKEAGKQTGNGALGEWMFTESGKLRPDTIARHILAEYPVATAQNKELAVYVDGVYSLHDKAITALIGELLRDQYNTGHQNNITKRLEGLCYEHNLILPDRASEPLLNCRNGMLDLRTLELKPHDPSYLSTRQISVGWDPDATCPTYDAWLESRVGRSQVRVVNEAISQFLDPSRTPSKALFLFGPSRSGKSTILRLAKELVGGEDEVSAVSLQQLSDDHFAAAEIYGKAINVCPDLPKDHVNDLSVFKRVTGDDPITANRKYGAMFTFRANSLFLFSANTLPTVGEESSAYLNRIVPVVFPKTYAGNENPHIEAALLAELPGILVRWVHARREHMQRSWRWTAVPPVVSDHFSAHSDRVTRFVASCCEIGVTTVPPGAPPVTSLSENQWPAGPSTLSNLFSAFNVWVKDEKGSSMSKSVFKDRMSAIDGVATLDHPVTKTKGVFNIAIRPVDEWEAPGSHRDLIPALFGDDPDGGPDAFSPAFPDGPDDGPDDDDEDGDYEEPGLWMVDEDEDGDMTSAELPADVEAPRDQGTLFSLPGDAEKKDARPAAQFYQAPFHLLTPATFDLLEKVAPEIGAPTEYSAIVASGARMPSVVTLDELAATSVAGISPQRFRAMWRVLVSDLLQTCGLVVAERRLKLPQDKDGDTDYLGHFGIDPYRLDTEHTGYMVWAYEGWVRPPALDDPIPDPVEHDIVFVKSGDDPSSALDTLYQHLEAMPYPILGFDVETNARSLSDPAYKVRTIQLGTPTFAVVLDAEDYRHRKAARVVLTCGKFPTTAHNAAFDTKALTKIGVFDSVAHAWENCVDTFLVASMIEPPLEDKTGYRDLKTQSATWFADREQSDSAKNQLKKLFSNKKWLGLSNNFKVYKTPEERNGWAQVDPSSPEMITYAASDVLDGSRLAKTIFPLAATLFPESAAREHRVRRICAEMEYRGMRVDAEYTRKRRAEALEKAAEAERNLIQMGLEDGPKDTKGMVALIESCGVEVRRGKEQIRKSGAIYAAPKLAAEDLTEYGKQDASGTIAAMAKELETFRLNTKLVDTYYDAYLNTPGGRIHPVIGTLTAATGRMSVSEPSMQNVPRYGVRECFIPDPGMAFISADFSSVEMRVAGALADDHGLRAVYQQNKDPYWEVARQIYGPEATKDHRQQCKAVALGRMYGSGIAKIASQLDIVDAAEAFEVASQVANAFDSAYPGLRQLQYRERSRIGMGFPLWVNEFGRMQAIDPTVHYKVVNYVVQGAARDVLVDALFRAEDAGLGEWLWLPIHDEIIIQVPESQVDDYCARLVEVMSTEIRGMPIPAEGTILGDRWKKAG